jgi:hypothetical protein
MAVASSSDDDEFDEYGVDDPEIKEYLRRAEAERASRTRSWPRRVVRELPWLAAAVGILLLGPVWRDLSVTQWALVYLAVGAAYAAAEYAFLDRVGFLQDLQGEPMYRFVRVALVVASTVVIWPVNLAVVVGQAVALGWRSLMARRNRR